MLIHLYTEKINTQADFRASQCLLQMGARVLRIDFMHTTESFKWTENFMACLMWDSTIISTNYRRFCDFFVT